MALWGTALHLPGDDRNEVRNGAGKGEVGQFGE
jgi:hypothetical protein